MTAQTRTDNPMPYARRALLAASRDVLNSSYQSSVIGVLKALSDCLLFMGHATCTVERHLQSSCDLPLHKVKSECFPKKNFLIVSGNSC
jgi:hypothetical protein